LFRGQGDVNYKLRSSFDRKFEQLPITQRVRKYESLLARFEDLYHLRFGKHVDRSVILSAAQHYGLPTRLLDWSSNPFVAAYFAFSSAALTNQTKGRVVIWAINKENPLVHSQMGLNIFLASNEGNKRAEAQKGYFSHLTGLFDNLEDYASAAEEQEEPLLFRFIIPVAEAATASSFLSTAGFNSYSLFPDIQGLTTAALEADWLSALPTND
jgi:hypothetical protein